MNAFSPQHNPPPLPVPPAAERTHKEMVEQLGRLQGIATRGEIDTSFTEEYCRAMDLFAKYQAHIVAASGLHQTCSPCCSQCCCHWVEDVYSFEAHLAAAYIRSHMPHRIPDIVSQCSEDQRELERLDEIVNRTLAQHADNEEARRLDAVDVLLSSFYQLRRPCPLLTHDNLCAIYPVRPITCRIYVSFSDPSLCDPSNINIADVKTYLLDMQEEASALLDEMHKRFDRFDGDMGLRSLLVKCLGDAGARRAEHLGRGARPRRPAVERRIFSD
jgi:Fe-S-cluster containining protein